jgi:hypothetical protein
MEVEVMVRTDGALLPGRTHDISESAMAAIFPVELRERAEGEVKIMRSAGTQTVRAIGRNHNVYRYGVQPFARDS